MIKIALYHTEQSRALGAKLKAKNIKAIWSTIAKIKPTSLGNAYRYQIGHEIIEGYFNKKFPGKKQPLEAWAKNEFANEIPKLGFLNTNESHALGKILPLKNIKSIWETLKRPKLSTDPLSIRSAYRSQVGREIIEGHLNKINPGKKGPYQAWSRPEIETELSKLSEFAPGIPSRHTKDIPRISSPEIWRRSIQHHVAKKAGCFPGWTRIITDRGLLYISDIVNNKLSVKVKCLLPNNTIAWRPITGWFRNGSTDEWLHTLLTPKHGFISTQKHKVFVFRDGALSKISSDQLKDSDFFAFADRKLSVDQEQFLYGAFLGDGSIDCRNRKTPVFRWSQSFKINSHNLYSNEVETLFKIKTSYSRNDRIIHFKHAFANQLAALYTPKKIVTKEFLQKLDIRALSVFFMDDGQWSPSKVYNKKLKRNTTRRRDRGRDLFSGQIYLYTNGFDINSVKNIQTWLLNEFNLEFKLRNRQNYFYLVLSNISQNKQFFNLVAPYIFKSMQYKCPIKVGSHTWKSWDKGEQLYPIRHYGQQIVLFRQGDNKNQIAKYGKYDITVEDGHSYFVSGVLVSNSHYDLRIIDDKSGKAYSWAMRHLPTFPGDKVLAKLQPTHTAAYSTWEGDIEEGYGAGTVKLFAHDKIELIKADPEHITFNVYKSNGDTERYALIHTGGDDYLFHNVTPTRSTRPEVPSEKPAYKSVELDKLDLTNRDEILSPKIDGALNAFVLRSGKPVEVYSYRPSVKSGNKLIDHTFRLPYYKTTVPKAFKGKTVLLGEVFAKDRQGKVLSNTETAARLLSNVWRSRELQEKAPLDSVVYNVLTYGGRNVSEKPYKEKFEILKRITSSIPGLKLPPLAQTPEQKKNLLEEIKSKKSQVTKEGLVVFNLNQHTPYKAKIMEDYDVYIRDVYPGEGKYKNIGVGGFSYSHTPHGPIIGRVGSGFTDSLRKKMWNNPELFKGHVARVYSQEKFPSNSLRVPAFKDFRSELWSKKASVELTNYQKDLQNRLKKQHGVLVDWSLGSGKTIGSIAAADQFGNTQVVAPASLRENFKKELRAYKPKNKFEITSYEKFTKRPNDVTNKTVIYDEAHRLRTSASKRSQTAQKLTSQAGKVLLLTGTPIQNAPHEIAPLINVAAGHNILPTSQKEFNEHYLKHVVDRPGIIRRLFGAKNKDEYHAKNLEDFKSRVSPYYMHYSGTRNPDVPRVHNKSIQVEMSPTQTKVYKTLTYQLPGSVRKAIEEKLPAKRKDITRLNSFLSASRQVANTSERFYDSGKKEYSPKLLSIAKRISKEPGQSLVYSNYLESGVHPLSDLLTKSKITHGVYTGKLGDREKKSLVNKYNKKKIQALIVSSAGGEGLDLKNTQNVHITEPHWNDAKIDQVIGRSARKGSHTALSPENRVVNVYRYQSVLPEKRHGFLWLNKSRPVSADQYLNAMSERKSKLNEEFLKPLRHKVATFIQTQPTAAQEVHTESTPAFAASEYASFSSNQKTQISPSKVRKLMYLDKAKRYANIAPQVETLGADAHLDKRAHIKKARGENSSITPNTFEDFNPNSLIETDIPPNAGRDPHLYKIWLNKVKSRTRPLTIDKNISKIV